MLENARKSSLSANSINTEENTEKEMNNKPSNGEVSSDLKAFLDSYEAFMDEYVEFMKNYSSNPANALSMMSKYAELLHKYEEFSEKAEAYDTEDMSAADAAYYLEVTTRIYQKMLSIYN